MISVIVTVHNVEDYLERCLKSIIGQTYSDLEIILVDDGSTDNSGSICDKYEKRDDRIRVIHTANNGAAMARNVGLKAASGDYIIMPDGDDVLHPRMIEILHRMIIGGDYDFSMCYGKRVFEVDEVEGRCARELDHISTTELSRDSCMKNLYLGSKVSEIQFKVLWNKLFKRDLLEGLLLKNTASHDTEYNNRAYQRISKALLLPDYLYYWIQHPNSITHLGYNLRYVNVIHSFLVCLDGIPEENTIFRSYCLRRMYRIMASHRYLSKGFASHEVAVRHCRTLLKQTIGEFLHNSYIPLSERFFLTLFNFCPFFYVIFVHFSEFKSKIGGFICRS